MNQQTEEQYQKRIKKLEEVETKHIETEEPLPGEPIPIPEKGENSVNTEQNPTDRMSETIGDIMKIITKMQKTLDGMQQKNAKNAESEQPARLTADDVVKNFFGDTKKA